MSVMVGGAGCKVDSRWGVYRRAQEDSPLYSHGSDEGTIGLRGVIHCVFVDDVKGYWGGKGGSGEAAQMEPKGRGKDREGGQGRVV